VSQALGEGPRLIDDAGRLAELAWSYHIGSAIWSLTVSGGVVYAGDGKAPG
jgi:hypothetical protein